MAPSNTGTEQTVAQWISAATSSRLTNEPFRSSLNSLNSRSTSTACMPPLMDAMLGQIAEEEFLGRSCQLLEMVCGRQQTSAAARLQGGLYIAKEMSLAEVSQVLIGAQVQVVFAIHMLVSVLKANHLLLMFTQDAGSHAFPGVCLTCKQIPSEAKEGHEFELGRGFLHQNSLPNRVQSSI